MDPIPRENRPELHFGGETEQTVPNSAPSQPSLVDDYVGGVFALRRCIRRCSRTELEGLHRELTYLRQLCRRAIRRVIRRDG